MKINYKKLIICLLIPVLIGSISSFFTSSSVNTWFPTLIKPSFNPPGWLFGPVWTLLYLLMGVALYLVLSTKKNKKRELAVNWFGIQLGLNFFWSLFFFGLRAPLLAFIEILALEASIIITTMKFYEIDRNAAYLMIPYILWVAFATILNFALWYLN